MGENTFAICREAVGSWNGSSNADQCLGVIQCPAVQGQITHKHEHQGRLCRGRAEARPEGRKTVTGENFSILALNFYESETKPNEI